MKYLRIIGLFLFVGAFSSCINDDDGTPDPDFPAINRGTVEVNRILLTWNPTGDTSNTQTFELYDPNGTGGAAPTINELITIEYPKSASFKSYDMKIHLFKDQTDVTSEIEQLGTKYIICFRGQASKNLQLNDVNNDANGRDLGTSSLWRTLDNTPRDGDIRVTLNFQDSGKEGLCDPGIRIFEGTMNYLLN